MTYSPIWSFGAIIKLFTTYPAYLGHPLCIGHWKSLLGMGNIKHWRDRMKTCSFVLSHLFPQEFFCVAVLIITLVNNFSADAMLPCAYTIEAPQLHHKAPTDSSHIEEFERKPRLVPSCGCGCVGIWRYEAELPCAVRGGGVRGAVGGTGWLLHHHGLHPRVLASRPPALSLDM